MLPIAIFSRYGFASMAKAKWSVVKRTPVADELHQEVGQQNRLTCILQNLLISMREKEQVLHQQDDAFRLGGDTPQSSLVFCRRTFLQQADLAFSLDGRKRVVQFMGRIADKRLLTPVSRINAVDHAGRIQTADKIDQDGTDHQHPQQQPADPLLDISAVLVARHHQHDEITLVVRIVDSRSQFFPFLETDYIAGIQGSDLLVGQIAGQGSTRLRDAVGIQQYFLLRQATSPHNAAGYGRNPLRSAHPFPSASVPSRMLFPSDRNSRGG